MRACALALAALAACTPGPAAPTAEGWRTAATAVWDGDVRAIHLAPDSTGMGVALDVVVDTLNGREWHALAGAFAASGKASLASRDFGIRLSGMATDGEGRAWVVVAENGEDLLLARPAPGGWDTVRLGARSAAMNGVAWTGAVRHVVWTDRAVPGQERVWHEWEGPDGDGRELVAERVVCCLDWAASEDGSLAAVASVAAGSTETETRLALLHRPAEGEWLRHDLPGSHSRREQAVAGRGPDVGFHLGAPVVAYTHGGKATLARLGAGGVIETTVLPGPLLAMATGRGCAVVVAEEGGMVAAGCDGEDPSIGLGVIGQGDTFHDAAFDPAGDLHLAWCSPAERRVLGLEVGRGCSLRHAWGPPPGAAVPAP